MAKARMLLVEDDSALAELLVWHFSREDFDVQHTIDGEEALLMAKETPPDIVLLDWWAEWCGPCRSFGPIFEKASETHEDIVFGKIDTDDQADLAEAFQIRSVPTLMVIREQILVFAAAATAFQLATMKKLATPTGSSTFQPNFMNWS